MVQSGCTVARRRRWGRRPAARVRGLAEADDVDPSHAHDAGLVAGAEVGASRVPLGDRDTFPVGVAHAVRYVPVELAVAQRETRLRGADLARLEGGGSAGGGPCGREGCARVVSRKGHGRKTGPRRLQR